MKLIRAPFGRSPKKIAAAMNTSTFSGVSLAALLSCVLITTTPAAHAAPDITRWVNAAQVNLRSHPDKEGAVLTRLAVGTPVRLISDHETAGFCEVALSDGTRGFLACRLLIDVAPALAAANAASTGGDATTRWVSGTGVNLRAEASLQAQVLTRLALNSPVQLLGAVAGSAFCEVSASLAKGQTQRGFTACQFLANAPVAMDKLTAAYLPDGKPNPQYDPVRAFWLRPSWDGLLAYAAQLEDAARPRKAEGTPDWDKPAPPRQTNAELDRMKTHLAKGVYGAAPVPMRSWEALKKSAAAEKPLPKAQRTPVVVGEFSSALVRALELPAIAPSLFKTAADVAPPDETVEGLSGRFHIVHTYRSHARSTESASGYVEGLWDIGQVSVSLTQAIVRTALYRDGSLRGEATRASQRRPVWGPEHEGNCEGYVHGFAFGDADVEMHKRYLGDEGKLAAPERLLSIYTREALAGTPTKPMVTKHTLERELTGFASGTWTHFDLDGDGQLDFAVWEGVGKGAGHMVEVSTDTDDQHLRIFMVNIAGRWFVLGSDSFGYGCGC
jgi:SH3-like domain-containing protein